MKGISYLVAGVLITAGIFGVVHATQAAEDNTAPRVTAINFSPVTIDTGSGDQTITLTVTLTDDLVGVAIPGDCGSACNTSNTQLRLRPLIGTQFIDFHAWTRVSGDDNNGTYTSTAVIPQYSKVGLWTVEHLYLVDKLNNNSRKTGVQLAALFPDAHLIIANTDDSASVTIEQEWVYSSEVARVTFPAGTVVTNYSGTPFRFYQLVNEAYSLSQLTDFVGAVAAMRLGIPEMGLHFSKPIQISMYIEDTSLIGENLLIQTFTEEGVQASWTPDSYCTVDFRQYCSFSVDHASLFMAQRVPIRAIVTGTKAGGGPEVRVFDTAGNLLHNFDAYSNWWGGINVAVGDINGDDENEIIVSTRRGGVPTVKIFDINGTSKGWDFDAFASGFRGGVSLAVGDIESDGIDEIIVAPMSGGAPQVRVFGLRGDSIVPVTEHFYAYDTAFRGGLALSVGDLEGDGVGDIITTPISGGGPHVRVFGVRNHRFVPVTLGVMAYANTFRGGVTTTMADLNGNGKDEVVTGVYGSGGPHVRVVGIGSNKGLALSSPGFFAFNREFSGGVSVAALDTNGNGQQELIVGVGGQDVGWIKIMSATGRLLSPSFAAYGKDYTGGITLAAGIF